MQNYNAIFCTVPIFPRISIFARRRIILAQALLCIVLISALGECSHVYAAPISSLAPPSIIKKISPYWVHIITPNTSIYSCPLRHCKVIDIISTQNTPAFCQTTGDIVFQEQNVFHHFRPAIRTDTIPSDTAITAIPNDGFGIEIGTENGAPGSFDSPGGGNPNNWWTKLIGPHGSIGWVNNIDLQGGIIISDLPYC